MAFNNVSLVYSYFADPEKSQAISEGDLYVGEPDLDANDIPQNQKQCYVRQEDGSDVPIGQPLNTGAGGIILVNGSPAQIVVDGNYSIVVLKDGQKYYDPNRYDGVPVTADSLLTDGLGGQKIIADLRAYSVANLTGDERIYVAGYYKSGDGGGGVFYWNATSTDADDGGLTILTDSHTGPGRWKRIYDKVLSALWFGAKRNSSESSSSFIQNAINSIPDGGVVFFERGIYLINSPLIVDDLQILQGEGSEISTIQAHSTFSGTALIKSANFDALTGTDTWLVSAGMKHGFGLKNLSLNINAKVTYGVQFYGKRYVVEDFMIYGGENANGAFYSEGGASGGQESQKDMPECQIGTLYIYGCKGYGLEFQGPHDGRIESLYISGNNIAGAKGMIVTAGVNSNGPCEIGHIHVYGLESDGFVATRAVKADLIISESIKSNPVNISSATSQISKIETFGTKTDANAVSVTVTGSQNYIGNLKIIDTAGGNGLEVTGNENIITAHIDGNDGDGRGLTLKGRGNIIEARIFDYSAVGGYGYWHNADISTIDNTLSLNIRNCYNGVDVVNTNSGRNRIFLSGSDMNTSGLRVNGTFDVEDDVQGWMATSIDTRYAKQYRTSSVLLNLASTAPQTINTTHRAFYTPDIGKIKVTMNSTTDTNISFDYLYVSSVDATDIVVFAKLNTAGTGTAQISVEYQI